MYLKSQWKTGLLAVAALLLAVNASAETKVSKDPVSVELKTYLVSASADTHMVMKHCAT